MRPLMELGDGRQGQTKLGGSEMGKYPLCWEEKETTPAYLSDMEYSHPPVEGPLLPVEGWLHTLN